MSNYESLKNRATNLGVRSSNLFGRASSLFVNFCGAFAGLETSGAARLRQRKAITRLCARGRSMKRSIIWGALLGLVLAFGGYRIYPALHPLPASHAELRASAILSQLEQIGPGSNIFIGDSITELAYMPTLCKKPVLNAGIGDFSSAGILQEAQALPADAKFDDAYLAFGTNDVVGPKRLNAEAFRRTYSAVMRSTADEFMDGLGCSLSTIVCLFLIAKGQWI
jgi:hypothetical protein